MDPEQNSDLEVGGMISTGVLRIPNVEGRDSGLVKCWATQESEMLGTQVVVANATLSVLGEGGGSGGREGGSGGREGGSGGREGGSGGREEVEGGREGEE